MYARAARLNHILYRTWVLSLPHHEQRIVIHKRYPEIPTWDILDMRKSSKRGEVHVVLLN